ncbi:MAG TPA: hypothetical protein IGS40_21495 [Trichormus sp. M33_DOE_039]|nr:hypothetical protein [Trichormus sp. M33_DOE_039]
MSLRNEPLEWQSNTQDAYVPIYHKGNLVGFFKQEYANEVIQFLNEDEVLKKALKRSCADLLKATGKDINLVNSLIRKYIQVSERPKHGTRAIALLLKERQTELDLSDSEFTKFCDTFKISPTELNSIYAGEAFDDRLLLPLTRILGITKERLLEVRDGSVEDNKI